ncbi:three-helix bundle dimerization domain-containing protein [Streptomyces griseorubiginosus]|uniref:three-helix bundle dimerization domain-containing protein n=1 Tax=Streptomyces griseorubiginosus TaxID=67304 RepID=UPI0034525EB3
MTVDEGIFRVAAPSPEPRDRVPTDLPERGEPHRPPRPGSPQDDDLAVRDIVARLAAAWPAVAETTVEALVASAFESFREAKVRAYVPILVERRVRGVLGALCRDTPSGPGNGRYEGEERK